MKERLCFVTVLLVITLTLTSATPPGLINYQGVLRDSLGNPRTGSFDMSFTFYSHETEGTLLLSDTHDSGAASGQVVVSNGLFKAQLGGGTITAGSEFSIAELFRDNNDVWMEIAVGSETLIPRVRVISSAYAQNARTLNGMEASAFAYSSHNHDASVITTGTLATTRGGTGLSSPGTSGNVLTSNGTSWISATPPSVAASGAVMDAANTTLTRSGSGNDVDPYKLRINLGNPNTWTGAQNFSSNTSFPGGIWNTSGNVGIGTSSPSASLDVQGTVHMFGSWLTLYFGVPGDMEEHILSGTADSDGFVVADLNVMYDGDRGYIMCNSPTSVQRASASVHYYTTSNTYVYNDSCTMPVRKGDSYQIRYAKTSGDPLFSIFWLPMGHSTGGLSEAGEGSSGNMNSPDKTASVVSSAAVPTAIPAPHKTTERNSEEATRPMTQSLPVDESVEPGDVLVINRSEGEKLRRCVTKADPMVVGIAGESTVMPENASELWQVVLGGITDVKVDATADPIMPGDILVSSATPGHAMKAQAAKAGTVVGKALEPLENGTGLIKVLVMLK